MTKWIVIQLIGVCLLIVGIIFVAWGSQYGAVGVVPYVLCTLGLVLFYTGAVVIPSVAAIIVAVMLLVPVGSLIYLCLIGAAFFTGGAMNNSSEYSLLAVVPAYSIPTVLIVAMLFRRSIVRNREASQFTAPVQSPQSTLSH